ncbi:MAG: NADH-quinone oxidoreductase subunit J [Deltaproteobacteria bacterium]|nr:NADH-quinone oxidoreductase subunit J [Deltaproteobacteria bacterium]
MPLSDLVFYLFAAMVVVGAAGAAISQNLVYAAFLLLAALFGVAAIFAWLSADYVAITQTIVYVGGILVLFLFAVMLTNRITDARHSNPAVGKRPAALVSLGLFGVLAYVSIETPWKHFDVPAGGETTHLLGQALLSTYVLPFEVLSVLLLAALVGAVVMSRKETPKP